jgi:hypothetical protein
MSQCADWEIGRTARIFERRKAAYQAFVEKAGG